MTKDVLTVIQEHMGTCSKGQKRIANFILNSYDKAAFMTASRLGQTTDVSESTVVRYAAELGYDGYPAMQKALQEMIRNKLTAMQRIEISDDRMGEHNVLPMVMHSDAENIRVTLEHIDQSSFTGAVRAILSARRIYIIGVRSAYALASFMGFYFNMMFENVMVVPSNSSSEVFEQILRIGAEDVIIGISFPRYSKRTLRAMRYATDRGATVVAITDSEASPLAEIANHVLLAKSDIVSFADSLVAPLSLVNALIVAVSKQKRGEMEGTFGMLEKIWDEYEVYEKTQH